MIPEIPTGRIYSPGEIIKAAVIHVEEREADDEENVLASEQYYGESTRPEREYPSRLQARSCHSPQHYNQHVRLHCPTCRPHAERAEDAKKWVVVSRWQQLYEGNFRAWLDMMRSMLTRFGIWNRETKNTDLSYDQAARCMADDGWAVSIMVMHIHPYFLTTFRISSTVSTGELLSDLARFAQPFRFGDLPAELRMRIYKFMVPVNQEYAEKTRNFKEVYDTRFDVPRWIHYESKIVRLARIRNLCGVSQEFRNEVSKIHYSCNTFISCDGRRYGPERMAKWAKVVGGQHLNHLRDLQVTFQYYKGGFDGFIVTYDLTTGLRADAIHSTDFDCDYWERDISEKVVAKKMREASEPCDNTGVIEFFTTNPDALRSIFYPRCYGPFEEHEDDDEGCPWAHFNERNAHSVTYGECYRECPW